MQNGNLIRQKYKGGLIKIELWKNVKGGEQLIIFQEASGVL